MTTYLEAATGELLEDGDGLEHRRLLAAADVVGTAATVHRRDRAADDVADVGEAPRLQAVPEEVERAAFGETRRDARERHVGPLPRAVCVEVPQHDHVQAEAARRGVGEVLTGELGDAVRRYRTRRHVLCGRVHLGVAVDRRRRREHDTHTAVRRCLEQSLRGEHVPLEVRLEHVAEAAHTGLPGEVEDAVDAAKVDRIAGEVDAPDVQPAHVLLLQRDVVVVGEAVEADDIVSPVAQGVREVRADEPGGAGDEVQHRQNCRDSPRSGGAYDPPAVVPDICCGTPGRGASVAATKHDSFPTG